MPSFSLVTLPSTNFFPGSYVAVNLGAGGNTAGAAPVNVILMGNALASSAAVSGGLVDGYVFGPGQQGVFNVNNVSDVINQFGARCELHLAYNEFAKTNPGVPVFLLPVKESTGSAASASITFAGTATAPGFVRAFVGDNLIDTGVNIGDTAATVATNVAASINSLLTMPATAAAVSTAITLTAANKGPRGNFIRFSVQVVGVAVGVTSTAQNFAYMSGGTVEDLWTNALATIDPLKFRYIVAAAEDATPSTGNLSQLVSQVTSQALPIPGIRQRVVAGVVGSEGVAASAAKNLNNPRCDLIWQQSANKTPFQLAAQAAAGYSLGENQAIPQLNFDTLGGLVSNSFQFKCSNPFDGSSTSRNDLTAALSAGVTPVAVGATQAFIVSAITTYSQGPTGNIDTRIRDHSIVTVMDFAADQIQNMWATQFSGKLAANDPPKGQSLPNSNIVTPSIVKAGINKILTDMTANGLIAQADLPALRAQTQVILDSFTPSRFDVMVNVLPIQLAHQLAVNLNQLSSLQ